jgi:hypothetical protein
MLAAQRFRGRERLKPPPFHYVGEMLEPNRVGWRKTRDDFVEPRLCRGVTDSRCW